MKENKLTGRTAIRWKQFNHKTYSVFCSLKKEVNIGVLTIATLAFANVKIASAQNDTIGQLKNMELEEVEITGTRVPLTEMQSAKLVTVLSRDEIQAAAVHSINDLLEYAAGVDVRQRSEFGIQTDISVRGGTFDQTTILLNGINICDPQTGHNTGNFPVSIHDIERIEILQGPAARVFGTSAFTGAINIVTKKATENQITAHLTGGGYGLLGTGAGVSYTNKRFGHQLSTNYSRSDGATKNSDFNTRRGFYAGSFNHKDVNMKWQLGLSDQKFGANTFYSAAYDNQYEETRKYIASVQAQTKGTIKFTPALYWNRSLDHFQLIRNTHTGENFHQTDVFGASLNASFDSSWGKTSLGAEIRNEGILSTNLGKPLDEDQYVNIPGEDQQYTRKDNRTNVGYYLEHNILFSRVTVSMGALANMNTALDHKFRFYPGIDISYRPTDNIKLFASWNMALRMPTFTDLYYKSPTIQGNVGLKPEKTQAFSIGANYRTDYFQSSLSSFYNKGKDMIYWVMYSADDIYHSANFELDNMGVELSSSIDFRRLTNGKSWLQDLSINYAYIYQHRKDNEEIYKSSYGLEYLRHKLVARLNHRVWNKLTANWAFRWQDRTGSYIKYNEMNQSTNQLVPYASYCVLDLRLSWNAPKYKLFAEANNLLNRTYYDFGNLPQPGIWLKAGISYQINL